MRPGDPHPLSAAKRFFRACHAKLPLYVHRKRVVVRLRADAGFFDERFAQFLDEHGVGFCIVARMITTLKERATRLRFRTFRQSGRWQVAQVRFKPTTWKQARRFVLVRRPQPERTEEAAPLRLGAFKDFFYHAFVTNLRLKPAAVYRFYTGRAQVELDIRELQAALSLGKVPTTRVTANATHFELILLAYDLVNWFRRLCLSGSWQRAR